MDYKRMNEFRLLGLTIAYYRKLRGMTQADLAEATQLSRTHISNIEAPNGKTSISLNKLFDIAEVLEVPMKDLFDFRETVNILFCNLINHHHYIFSNISLLTPHTGQVQSSGISSKAVPGAIPLSGSPTSGS